ncbi:MAG: TMEM165/GDT1 family protein [Candidatus Omnitrophica bacterium]|nr:TMEM165/GDT1 family protein [Candidatus Omnitrophota bacterium]
MDWKVFLATFGAVFFAELADKTQIVGLGMAAKSGKPVSVWLGSVAAYIIVTAVTVAIGMVAGKFFKPEVVRMVGGVLFIALGILMLVERI